MMRTMKRYLYILLVAVAAMFTSCDLFSNIEYQPVVAYYFGNVEVKTTENSATIDAGTPYMTVEGIKTESATIYLEYWLESDDSVVNTVEEYTETDGHIIFTLNELPENTAYWANIVISSKYGTERSLVFEFATQKHIPVTNANCSVEVDSKGLMADVKLAGVHYLVDGEPQNIHVFKVEYARQSAEEWVGREFAGSNISNGSFATTIPFEGYDYLVENRNYRVRVTLYPASGDYEPITTETFDFKTEYAEVTANIAMPQLSIDGEGIHAVVESVEVFYDGIAAAAYKDGYPIEYYFNYRMKGTEQWTEVEAQEQMGDIRITIPASELEEGATYEVEARIIAGAERKVRQSAVAEIDVPISTPPTPPVGGEGDTSTITGTWHLTSWRGVEPSFDVYLDITEDGVVTLWQRIESREWECFYSTADIVGGIISGTYTDGVQWGASYSVTVSGDTMTWIDTADSTDISVYTRSALPEGIEANVKRAAAKREKRFL